MKSSLWIILSCLFIMFTVDTHLSWDNGQKDMQANSDLNLRTCFITLKESDKNNKD